MLATYYIHFAQHIPLHFQKDIPWFAAQHIPFTVNTVSKWCMNFGWVLLKASQTPELRHSNCLVWIPRVKQFQCLVPDSRRFLFYSSRDPAENIMPCRKRRAGVGRLCTAQNIMLCTRESDDSSLFCNVFGCAELELQWPRQSIQSSTHSGLFRHIYLVLSHGNTLRSLNH